MGLIYQAYFKTNGKSYIGQTSRNNLEDRKKEHLQASKDKPYLFYNAIRKYGWNDIEWSVLEECNNEELNEKEIFYIKKYNTYIGFNNCNGYNMTERGDCINHCMFDTKDKINELLEEYKKCGSVNELAKKHDCGYTVIYNILTGIICSEFTGFYYNDKTFLKKYMKKGLKYTNEQIDEVIQRNKKGESNSYISEQMNVPIKWVQDILSGRIMSKRTGIKHITRDERQLYNPVNSKRSKEEILTIVEDYYANKLSLKEIGEKYNIVSARLSEILSGKTWSAITHLTEEDYEKEKLKRNPPKEKVKKKSSYLYTDKDVLDMVNLYKLGRSKKEIAEKYNTTEGYVYKIVTGQRRNDITHIK